MFRCRRWFLLVDCSFPLTFGTVTCSFCKNEWFRPSCVLTFCFVSFSDGPKITGQCCSEQWDGRVRVPVGVCKGDYETKVSFLIVSLFCQNTFTQTTLAVSSFPKRRWYMHQHQRSFRILNISRRPRVCFSLSLGVLLSMRY